MISSLGHRKYEEVTFNENDCNKNTYRKKKIGNPTKSNSKIVSEYSESNEYNRNVLLEIQNTVRSLKSLGLAAYPFYLIHSNCFCRQINGVAVPCEIAIAEFSLMDGVRRTYHTIIDPGKIPIGYAFDAEVHSAESHQIPLPPNSLEGEKNFQRIFKDITLFLSQVKPFMPPVYTYPSENISIVKNVLCTLHKSCSNNVGITDDIFRVYPLTNLFYELKNACARLNDEKGFPFLCLAERELERDNFSHTKGISCRFHEDTEAIQYCSLSLARRWSYIVIGSCCKDLEIELLPGRHFPKEIDLSYCRNVNLLTENVLLKETKILLPNYSERLQDPSACSPVTYSYPFPVIGKESDRKLRKAVFTPVSEITKNSPIPVAEREEYFKTEPSLSSFSSSRHYKTFPGDSEDKKESIGRKCCTQENSSSHHGASPAYQQNDDSTSSFETVRKSNKDNQILSSKKVSKSEEEGNIVPLIPLRLPRSLPESLSCLFPNKNNNYSSTICIASGEELKKSDPSDLPPKVFPKNDSNVTVSHHRDGQLPPLHFPGEKAPPLHFPGEKAPPPLHFPGEKASPPLHFPGGKASPPPLHFPGEKSELSPPLHFPGEKAELPPLKFPHDRAVPHNSGKLKPHASNLTKKDTEYDDITVKNTDNNKEFDKPTKVASEVPDMLKESFMNRTVYEDGTENPINNDTETIKGPHVVNDSKTHEEDVTKSNVETKPPKIVESTTTKPELKKSDPSGLPPKVFPTVEHHSTDKTVPTTAAITTTNTKETGMKANSAQTTVTTESHPETTATSGKSATTDLGILTTMEEPTQTANETENATTSEVTTAVPIAETSTVNQTKKNNSAPLNGKKKTPDENKTIDDKEHPTTSTIKEKETAPFKATSTQKPGDVTTVTIQPSVKLETTTSVNISENIIDHKAPMALAASQQHAEHSHASTGRSSAFLQPTESAAILAGVFVGIAILGYVGLLVWRRVLEKRYGNREMLVNEDDFYDTNDLRNFEEGNLERQARKELY